MKVSKILLIGIYLTIRKSLNKRSILCYQNLKTVRLNNRTGYVGLPLALEIAKQRSCLLTKNKLERFVFGFDIDKSRVNELSRGIDRNKIFSKEQLKEVKQQNLLVIKIFLRMLMYYYNCAYSNNR